MAKSVGFNIKLSIDGKEVVVSAKKGVEDLGKALGTLPSRADKAQLSLAQFATITTGIRSAYLAVQDITGQLQTFIDKSNAATEAQTKLRVVMGQRMGASNEDVEYINQLVAAQTKLGVVGGTVQRSGLQQLATFASQRQTLATLLPAMNNLLVQQNGLNASTQDAVGVANLMGKALMGNVGALTRVGITLTDHQKELIKTGDEYTRATTLAEAITQNVGDMNAEIAKTDAGKVKQQQNAFAGLEAQIGKVIGPYQELINTFGQIGFAVTGVMQMATALIGLVRATRLATLASKMWSVAQATFATAGQFLIAIINGQTMSLAAFRAGIRATIASLGIIGVAIAALNLVFEALTSSLLSANDSLEDTQKVMSATERRAEALKSSNDAVSASVAEEKNHIQALTDIIHSNTAKLKDKEKAVKELKSIVPTFTATIDAEGRAHDNASTAIATHIHMLDLLQRAIAAYNTGQKIQQEASDASFAASQANQKVNTKQHNVDAVQNELDRHHDAYYDTHTYTDTYGVKSQYDVATEAGGRKIQELHTQESALASAQASARQANANNRAAQQALKGLSTWQNNYVMEGLGESDRKLMEGIMNNVSLHGGDYNAITADLFGRSLTPAETGRGGGGGTSGGRTGRGTVPPPADKPLTWIENPKGRSDYEQNSKYLQQEIDNLDAANAVDAARIKVLQEQKAAVDQIIGKYNQLENAPEPPKADEALQTYADLDYAIQYYENELRTALPEARPGIQAHIDKLSEIRKKWEDADKGVKEYHPEDIGKLNTIGDLDRAIQYYQQEQSKQTADEITNTQRTINALEDKRKAMMRGADLLSRQNEIDDINSLSEKELRVRVRAIGFDGLTDKIKELQKLLGDTKNPLTSDQRKQVERMIGVYEQWRRKSVSAFDTVQKGWDSVKGIGGGISSITDALQNNGNAWEKLTSVIDGFIQLYESISAIVGIINMITMATGGNTAAKQEEAAATDTSTAATAANAAAQVSAAVGAVPVIAANKLMTASFVELATAKYFAAHAEIPFVGAGIAAGFSAQAVAQTIAAGVMPFANGGIVSGPTLALVGEYGGAKNNPEVVAPLDKLKDMLDGGAGTVSVNVSGRLKNNDIALSAIRGIKNSPSLQKEFKSLL